MNRTGAAPVETAVEISVLAEALGSAAGLSEGSASCVASDVAAGLAVSVVDDDFDHTIKPSSRIAKIRTMATRLDPPSFLAGAFCCGAAFTGAGVVETLTREREVFTGTGGTETLALFRAATFLVALRTVDFLGAALRATLFFAADFLAADFFTADFLATVFFAVDFLAADFFAVDFFTATDISSSSGSGRILA